MKFLLLGDLHGFIPQKPTFSYDAIISTGDVCDDRFIRPILREAFKKDVSWRDLVTATQQKELIRKTMFSGKRVLSRLNSFQKPVYVVRGNWDLTLSKSYEETYITHLVNVIACDSTFVELDDCGIVGYSGGFKPELSFAKEEWADLSQSKRQKKISEYVRAYQNLEKVYEKGLKSEKPLILLSHNQPFHTKLDKVTNKPANIINKHMGSVVIRRIIDQYQPQFCVAGHIHENAGKVKLRKTLCVNAGSKAKAWLLDTQKGTIEAKRLKIQR